MSQPIYSTELVLFDLDMTLVDTHMLQTLRDQKHWSEVYKRIPETRLLYDPKDLDMQALMKGDGLGICSSGIVTSSPRTYAEKICNYHNIDMPVLCAYHDTKKHKPHPEPIYYACKQVGVDPARTVYVGDSVEDMRSILDAGGIGIFNGPLTLERDSAMFEELGVIPFHPIRPRGSDFTYVHEAYIDNKNSIRFYSNRLGHLEHILWELMV